MKNPGGSSISRTVVNVKLSSLQGTRDTQSTDLSGMDTA